MEAEHWHARWREGRIGFHEGRVNARLQQHWPALGVARDAAVLVPLCGKALDLTWLASRGHAVLGVELSAIAVEDFFREQELVAERARLDAYEVWRSGPLTILCGDFFALDRARAEAAAGGPLAAWWDRAALIALPPAKRLLYAEQIARLTAPSARGLLVGFEYPQAEKEGPPFAVAESEVRALFAPPRFAPPEMLERDDLLAREPRYREQGLSRVAETLFRLARATGGGVA